MMRRYAYGGGAGSEIRQRQVGMLVHGASSLSASGSLLCVVI
jgi:hypothetical protein